MSYVITDTAVDTINTTDFKQGKYTDRLLKRYTRIAASMYVLIMIVIVMIMILVTCWERADLLALVCGVYCEFVTFPSVSWVRCGT